jgi:hypothetical protein
MPGPVRGASINPARDVRSPHFSDRPPAASFGDGISGGGCSILHSLYRARGAIVQSAGALLSAGLFGGTVGKAERNSSSLLACWVIRSRQLRPPTCVGDPHPDALDLLARRRRTSNQFKVSPAGSLSAARPRSSHVLRKRQRSGQRASCVGLSAT